MIISRSQLFRSTAPILTLILIASACGGDQKEPVANASPTIESTDAATPTLETTATPLTSNPLCQPPTTGQVPVENYDLELKARWEDKTRVVIEGSINLPAPGRIAYYICQNDQLARFLRPIRQPRFEDGEIQAESKIDTNVTDPPPFDPKGQFKVVFSIVGVTGVPFFIHIIPVEGTPD